MPLPIFLAHGLLGPLDEVIFVGVGVIFAGMMGLSWWRSQALDIEETEAAETSDHPTVSDDDPEHFSLK
ncbi:MAG: hypothetical protein H7X77_09945 [Anaerolineae bacterium]|nr:hypothetical protein [Anaerolineae bacterium]